MGWRGSAAHWHNYETAYLLLAGLATPLVISVHTVVSLRLRHRHHPGLARHDLPALLRGRRHLRRLRHGADAGDPAARTSSTSQDFITTRHLQNMGKVMLATGLIVVYGYVMELFFGWYSGNLYERFMLMNRAIGPYKWHWFALLLCNAVVPQLLWFRRVRTSPLWLFVISMFVSVGMWLERFIIIVTSLHRDFLPASWGMYSGTIWDWGTFIGTIGLFLSLLFLFIRFLPMISIFEMRTIVPGGQRGGEYTEVPPMTGPDREAQSTRSTA